MGEVLGLGVSHYPSFARGDEHFSRLLRWALADPQLPEALRSPEGWPAELVAEYGADQGLAAGRAHRDTLLAGFRKTREALDEFRPDAVLIWGDDQYENFQEDVVPAFSVLAYPHLSATPWQHEPADRPNIWGEPADFSYPIDCRADIAKELASALIDSDFDMAYAYRPLHAESYPLAFVNTVLYLDYDRRGFPYPIIAAPVNCYGRKVIVDKGSMARLPNGSETEQFDPPSPSPDRCIALGAATARFIRESPYRIAVVASSSWSHAFLNASTWHLYPDMASDRAYYDALVRGDIDYWCGAKLSDLERSGQQEMLNWFCLLGAMSELGMTLSWSSLVETYVCNSNKCFAIFH